MRSSFAEKQEKGTRSSRRERASSVFYLENIFVEHRQKISCHNQKMLRYEVVSGIAMTKGLCRSMFLHRHAPRPTSYFARTCFLYLVLKLRNLFILATTLSTDEIHYIKDLHNLQQILRYKKFLYNKIFNN